MKIKISRNLIVWTFLIFIIVSLIYTMVVLNKMRSDEANDVRPVPEGYTSPTVNINTTIFDPIIGNWILPNYKTGQTINITIDRYGFVTKWKRNNDNLTYVRGPWTKVSENSYRIRWLVEGEWFEIYGGTGSFIPTNETIVYNRSTDSIIESGDSYIRYNATITNNSNYK